MPEEHYSEGEAHESNEQAREAEEANEAAREAYNEWENASPGQREAAWEKFLEKDGVAEEKTRDYLNSGFELIGGEKMGPEQFKVVDAEKPIADSGLPGENTEAVEKLLKDAFPAYEKAKEEAAKDGTVPTDENWLAKKFKELTLEDLGRMAKAFGTLAAIGAIAGVAGWLAKKILCDLGEDDSGCLATNTQTGEAKTFNPGQCSTSYEKLCKKCSSNIQKNANSLCTNQKCGALSKDWSVSVRCTSWTGAFGHLINGLVNGIAGFLKSLPTVIKVFIIVAIVIVSLIVLGYVIKFSWPLISGLFKKKPPSKPGTKFRYRKKVR